MSVLTALYETYCNALEKNMVDRTDLLSEQTVLLPVYHTSKKSTGANDMITVTLSEKGKFIKAEWMPKEQIAIFPVTEDSIIRAGTVIAPHPLCDEFSYLAKEFDPEKNKKYENERKDWVSYTEEGHPNQLLKIIDEYLSQGTIFGDCVASLFSGMNYEVTKDYAVIVSPGEKAEKTIKLNKTFVTFEVETEMPTQANLSVTTNREIHQNYIDYVREKNASRPQEKCDISGEMTYCVSRHRGLMGNAKVVSISNHNETYYGRFDKGEEIVHIGYETSQRIHLMLKYLLENEQNRRQIGDSCFLVNWFSDDIGNKEALDLVNRISPESEEEEDEEPDEEAPKTFGGSYSSLINDYITGKERTINSNAKFYLMILDKISNGRISVKYFREVPKSELYENAKYWYETTNWPFFSGKSKKMVHETPSLFRYADTIFGLENEKGYVECKNSKLKSKTMERLLSCILEKRKFPRNLKNRMFVNLCNPNSYDKTWNYVLALGCSVFKKSKIDEGKKEEVSEMLDISNQNRSYLYGRLLAVYEKIEQDVLDKKVTDNEISDKATDNKGRRATNAERLWSAYTKMPSRTLKILEDKVRPYKEILLKSNDKAVRYYDSIIIDITGRLREAKDYEVMKNRSLDEDFIFGYYAQKQEFYKKKINKEENSDSIQEEGGNQ